MTENFENVCRFRLGTFECAVVGDNRRKMTVQQLFPDIPSENLKQAMQEVGAASEDVMVGFDCLYVDTGQQRVLVDTGTGQGHLLESLVAAGVEPAAIDTVILTHGDGDHIGGIDGFSNARFALTTEAWAMWTDPQRRAGMVEEFLKIFRGKISEDELAQRSRNRDVYGAEVLPALAGRVDRVDPEVEFIPGFKLFPAPGHRSDHTAVEIQSDQETLLHVVDAIRHPIQARHPGWASFIDSHPDQVGATNAMLLQRAAERRALVFGAHLPFPGLGRVRSVGGGWRWEGFRVANKTSI